MTNDEIRKNGEARMTKAPLDASGAIRHSEFGFLSSFVIRNWEGLVIWSWRGQLGLDIAPAKIKRKRRNYRLMECWWDRVVQAVDRRRRVPQANKNMRNEKRRNTMQTSCRSLVWLSIGSVAGSLALSSVRGDSSGGGGGGAQGVYFRGGIGPEFAHETDVNEFFGPLSGVKVKYDTGIRISVAGGYQFCRYFSAEVESGILYNSIKSITGSPEPDASLANVPLLANAVFHIPLDSNFVPYCGLGVGGSTSVLDIDHATIDGTALHGDDSDFVWAAHGFAGFRYEFNAHMGVGFGYRFLATGEPKWDAISAGGSGRIGFDNARTHSFLAEFTLKF